MIRLEVKPYPCPRPRVSRKTGGVYYNKNYKLFRKTIVTELEQIEYPKNIDGSLHVIIEFYFKGPKKGIQYRTKKPDIDNLCKSFLDSLQDYGAFLDDSQIVKLTATKYTVKNENYIKFELKQI
tara:strand:- start:716 stop:1087 length:372 start_codon:yes stop_codon:yes gene_type:complete